MWILTGLIAIYIFGVILRLIGVGHIDPFTDEYLHLKQAYDWYHGVFDIYYFRSIFTTFFTYLGFITFQPETFYEYLESGRFFLILISSAIIFPMYYIGIQIHKSVGWIAVLLFTLSPWGIAVSQIIREYSWYPIIILSLFSIFIYIQKTIKVNTEKIYQKIFISGIIFFLFSVYAIWIDGESTLKIGVLITFLIFSFLFFPFLSQISSFEINLLKLAIISIILAISFNILSSDILNLHFDISKLYWIKVFFSDLPLGPMHWSSGLYWNISGLVFLCFSLIYLLKEKNNVHFINLIVFTIGVLFYILLFDRYFKPRYIYYLFPFFILIISTGVYQIFSEILSIKNGIIKKIFFLGFMVYLFFTFSYKNIIYAVGFDGGGYNYASGEYHESLDGIYEYFGNNNLERDLVITTVYGFVLEVDFGFDRDKIKNYYFMGDDFYKILEKNIIKYPTGYVILDQRRNLYFSKGLPIRDFYIGDRKINLEYQYGDLIIYKW